MEYDSTTSTLATLRDTNFAIIAFYIVESKGFKPLKSRRCYIYSVVPLITRPTFHCFFIFAPVERLEHSSFGFGIQGFALSYTDIYCFLWTQHYWKCTYSSSENRAHRLHHKSLFCCGGGIRIHEAYAEGYEPSPMTNFGHPAIFLS